MKICASGNIGNNRTIKPLDPSYQKIRIDYFSFFYENENLTITGLNNFEIRSFSIEREPDEVTTTTRTTTRENESEGERRGPHGWIRLPPKPTLPPRFTCEKNFVSKTFVVKMGLKFPKIVAEGPYKSRKIFYVKRGTAKFNFCKLKSNDE